MSKWDDTREARFWAKVEKTATCWLWRGTKTAAGYGQIRYGGSKMYAHRYSVMLALGKGIPDAVLVRHACDTPSCVNPAHLSLGTQKDNMADAVTRNRLNPWLRDMTACRRGHPFSPDNTSILPSGSRRCLTCHRQSNAKSNGDLNGHRSRETTRGQGA